MPDQNVIYQKQVEDRSVRASAMKKMLLDPFRGDDGILLVPSTKAEAEKRNMVLESAIQDSAYSLTQNGKMIAATHARSLQGYERKYGRLPSDDLLASAHKAIENAILLTAGKEAVGGVFESANMSTTEGVQMRDRLISLVLPVLLQSVTANMVTYIPGEFNQSEFFRVFRVAGSTFGTVKKGDKIRFDYDGLYSVMDQRALMGYGDGSTKTFTFKTKDINGVAYPIKPKRTRIWLDRKKVAEDNGGLGALVGTYVGFSDTPCMVSGTVDYSSGEISISFTEAPAENMEIHVGFDVNIEHDPSLIPRIDHQMYNHVLYPHESAITGNATIQAIWALRREMGLDIENMTMQALRNLLAADKDRKHLRDMRFHARDNVDWVYVGTGEISLREHYESVNAALLEVDTKLMKANGVSGLVGIVAGTQACNVFRYLPSQYFTPVPGYRSIAQPHYVGKVFGQWDLYCDPQADNGWECLCFAKGPDHGQTAYVAGDAVPAMTFHHPVLGDLVKNGTMWDLAYRDMQPFDGEKYLCRLNFIDDKAPGQPDNPAPENPAPENPENASNQ